MEAWLDSVVLSEVAAGFFALLTALVSILAAKQKVNLIANNAELETKRQSLALKVDLARWADVEKELDAIEKETCIDRVLVLRCWNGWRSPLYTTAAYQWRAEGQANTNYISVPLDDGYISRINTMNDDGQMIIDVNAHAQILPQELIVRIYMAEAVKHSIWFPVGSHEIQLPRWWGWVRIFGIRVKAHTYCSFATHDDDPIPAEVMQRCQNLTFQMRGAIFDI